jgi:hypothetical protein
MALIYAALDGGRLSWMEKCDVVNRVFTIYGAAEARRTMVELGFETGPAMEELLAQDRQKIDRGMIN